MGRLLDAGLINACGYMLNTTEFRDAACDVMRQVAGALRCCGALCCGVLCYAVLCSAGCAVHPYVPLLRVGGACGAPCCH